MSGVGRNKSTQVTFMADLLGRSGGDYYTTYFPQPSFVTSAGWSFHHSGDNYAVLDFRSVDRVIDVGGNMDKFKLATICTIPFFGTFKILIS